MTRLAGFAGATLLIGFVILAVVSCSEGRPTSLPQQCVSDAFSIGYPEGWWVHPPDAERGIDACAHFAAEPFVAEREDDDFGWSGARVSIWTGSGCRGSFDVVTAEEELTIDGRPAYRHELERGEGGPDPTALEYLVRVAGGLPCETSSWLVARAESDDPGDLAENRRVLDLMMQTLDLDVRARDGSAANWSRNTSVVRHPMTDSRQRRYGVARPELIPAASGEWSCESAVPQPLRRGPEPAHHGRADQPPARGGHTDDSHRIRSPRPRGARLDTLVATSDASALHLAGIPDPAPAWSASSCPSRIRCAAVRTPGPMARPSRTIRAAR